MTNCRLVLIEWLDSRRPDPDWKFIGDVANASPVKCASVGWLLRDDEVKVLCPNMGDLDMENPQGCGLIEIPAGCVSKVTSLAEA